MRENTTSRRPEDVVNGCELHGLGAGCPFLFLFWTWALGVYPYQKAQRDFASIEDVTKSTREVVYGLEVPR